MRLIVVSGLSGSGKSVALDMLEDLDFYCVDNIPAGLLPGFIAYTVRTSESTYRHTAVGVDARQRILHLGQHALLGAMHAHVHGLFKDDGGVIGHVVAQPGPFFVGAELVHVCKLLAQARPFLFEVQSQVRNPL